MSNYLDRIVARTQATETLAPAPEPAAVHDPLEADASDGLAAIDPFAAETEGAIGATMPGAAESSGAAALDTVSSTQAATIGAAAPSISLPFGRESLGGASTQAPGADPMPLQAGGVTGPDDADAEPEAIIIGARTITGDRIAPNEPSGMDGLVILPISDLAAQGFVPALQPISDLAAQGFVPALQPISESAAQGFAPGLAPEATAGAAETVIATPQITIGRITVQVTIVPDRPALPAARPAGRRTVPAPGPALAPLRLRLGLGQM
jgi:hypothetical protein